MSLEGNLTCLQVIANSSRKFSFCEAICGQIRRDSMERRRYYWGGCCQSCCFILPWCSRSHRQSGMCWSPSIQLPFHLLYVNKKAKLVLLFELAVQCRKAIGSPYEPPPSVNIITPNCPPSEGAPGTGHRPTGTGRRLSSAVPERGQTVWGTETASRRVVCSSWEVYDPSAALLRGSPICGQSFNEAFLPGNCGRPGLHITAYGV